MDDDAFVAGIRDRRGEPHGVILPEWSGGCAPLCIVRQLSA
jgi:hypothetical protein